MGVDSNLPDSRENEGFWKAYPPIAKLGKSFSEMADPVWFDKLKLPGLTVFRHGFLNFLDRLDMIDCL